MVTEHSGAMTRGPRRTQRGDLLELSKADSRVTLHTGPRYVGRQRLQARLGGAAAAAVGIALLSLSAWGWLLILLGGLAFVGAPLLLRPRALLILDLAAGRIRPLKPGLAEVAVSDVVRIDGRQELYGWDPQSVIYAELADGRREALLVFRGTDDPLSIEACRRLGELLGKPARFTNQYGVCTECASGSDGHVHAPGREMLS